MSVRETQCEDTRFSERWVCPECHSIHKSHQIYDTQYAYCVYCGSKEISKIVCKMRYKRRNHSFLFIDGVEEHMIVGYTTPDGVYHGSGNSGVRIYYDDPWDCNGE